MRRVLQTMAKTDHPVDEEYFDWVLRSGASALRAAQQICDQLDEQAERIYHDMVAAEDEVLRNGRAARRPYVVRVRSGD